MKTRALLMLIALSAAAPAEVIRLQNGVAPTAEYAGCVDTRISIYNDQEARGRRGGDGKTTVFKTFVHTRPILVKFDLAAAKGKTVGKALLRIYCVDPGRMGSQMIAHPLTVDWDESATGFEHTKTDDDKTPKGNWTNKGGDYDKAVQLTAELRGGPYGHAFEFDVTAIAADWLAGKRPNHGLILWSGQHTQHEIASSEWPNAEYRPELLIAARAEDLPPWPAPVKDVALSPVAKTPDTGKAVGEYATALIGLRNDASRRGAADGYIKAGGRLAKDWSWMPMLRVGGGAGEFNAAWLSFDLKGLTKTASIKSAKLRLQVVGGSSGVRFGVYAGKCGDVPTKGERNSPDPVAVAKLAIPRRPKPGDPPATIEWDVTGAARAAAGKALELSIAHVIEGGLLDVYSSKYDDPDLRPVLELEVSPAPAVTKLTILKPLIPPMGDYWVEPMKAVHKRFRGTPNTLGQYGDSITITMAFLATHSYGKTCIPAKCPPAVAKKLTVLDTYASKRLWREWKHPKYGNNGSMTVAWAFANIDAWQKLCKPEVAVILFGTNDVSYGPTPPVHTEMMAHVVDRILADGTIPILTTLPPRGDQKGDSPRNKSVRRRVRELRRAQIAIARAKKVPLIDLYTEIVSRQPDDWDKKLMGDSLHPSYRDPWKKDYTPEGLANSGYTLRNYLTMMMYADIIEKVLLPAGEGLKP